VFYYDEIPNYGVVIGFTLEAANSDTPQIFHDRIEAIAEIIPDEHTTRKRRILNELLPKN
jgi:hypothetical protein